MKGAIATTRLPSLSLWIGSRLASRKAITWVTKAFNGEKGLSNDELTSLLRDLSDQAAQRTSLSAEMKTIWRLLYYAGRDRGSRLSQYHVVQIARDIRQGTFSADDVRTLIEFVRPRLTPIEPSKALMTEEEVADHPRRWVIWRFATASGGVDHGIGKLDERLLSSLPSVILDRISIESTNALVAVLDVAREAGWMRDGRDLANRLVARIAYRPTTDNSLGVVDDNENGESRDPDAYHDGFAPLLRLMTAAFDALAEKDLDAVKRVANLWDGHSEALFVRLQAYAGLRPSIWDGGQVGQFLQRLPDLLFWRAGAFPEVATLRALRWSDLATDARERIAERLIVGPKRDDFDPDREISRETLSYWRDLEIARVVDNNQDASKQFLDIIKSRRFKSADFPDRVPAIEVGATDFRIRGVPEGDAKAFSNVADEDLVVTLAKATKDRPFGEGDDADAYVRRNRPKVIELLAQREGIDEDTATVWELALSYPHEKADNIDDARKNAKRVATLAFKMDAGLFERVSDRLCYWLDAVDEQLAGFSGAVSLWERLLPYAVNRENANISDSAVEADLYTIALNVPFGHLIFFFLRRCPTMPAEGETPPLPEPFVGLLKEVKGRTRLLLATRMATTMNYFWRADEDWLKDVALEPMLSNGHEGTLLWEAFAKYGPVPSHTLWQVIEAPLIKHVAQGRLSKEALRRLAEMLVVVWSWTKTSDNKYSVNLGTL
jgi:hypothetical protein